MVTFLSLFLGLVTGELPVRLVVGPEVAAVELRLDGETVARLEEAPWEAAVDLGDDLAPRRLTAVAFDAEGRETSRAQQMLNLPRPPAEARVTLDETGRRARLHWQNVFGEAPLEVRLSFDGEPLVAADPRAIELPPYDPEALHYLRAEMRFAGDVTAVAETVFGAASDQVAQELTGVPVRLADGRDRLAPSELRGAFEAGGGRARVMAVETPPAEVVVVPDPGARDALRRIGAPLKGGLHVLPPSHRLRRSGWLGAGHTLRILFPYPLRRQATAVDFDVFPLSRPVDGDEGGIYWLLAEGLTTAPPAGETRLADAVAAAAAQAAAHDRRRAVLLLLSGPIYDASRFDPAVVEAYLARLGVPLHVWSLTPEKRPAVGGEHGFSAATPVGSISDLHRATRELLRDLETQRIVWLEGRWLPQEVRFGAGEAVRRVAELPELEPSSLAVRSERVRETPEPARRAVVESLLALGQPAAPPPLPGELAERLRRARRLAGVAPNAAERLGPWPLVTDLPAGDERRRLAAVAEGVAAAYAERFGRTPPPLDPDRPEVVVLFRQAASYRLFADLGTEGAGLGLEGHAGGGLAVLHLEREPEESRSFLVHELVHLLNRRTFEGALPPWLEEGLAVELASHRLDEAGRPRLDTLWGERVARQRGLRLGMGGTRLEEEIELTGALAALGRLARAREAGRLPPLSALRSLPAERFAEPDGRELRYAQAGALVSFLLDGPRADGFRRFLAAVAAGEPAATERLTEALGSDIETLDRSFRRWLVTEARRHQVLPGLPTAAGSVQ